MLSFDCPDCGVHMSASDEKTLAWGIESHACELGEAAVDPWALRSLQREARDPLQVEVVRWLASEYGRPFWWFAPGERPLVVA